MPPLENNRHERFCLELLSGCSQGEAAARAGYGGKNARIYGYRLMAMEEVKTRFKELQEQASSSRIMSIIERKERLTKIARATTNLKRNDPVAAIVELNRMDGIYEAEKTEVTEEVVIKTIEVHLNDRPYNLPALP